MVPFWLVPGSAEDFFQEEKTRAWPDDPAPHFLFLQPRTAVPLQWQGRVAFLPQITSTERQFLLRQSQGLLTAYHEHSLLELQTFFQWAQWAPVPMLISKEQNHLFPGLVRENTTGWILRDPAATWEELTRSRGRLDLIGNLEAHPPTTLVDSATNQLNRLFASARSSRG
jgi:hypothetical protein